jgi:hypothetical protein
MANVTPLNWKHLASAVALGAATAIGEWFTGSINFNSVITAAEVGYTLSFSFQSLKVAIVEALTAHAATVAAAVTGAPSPQQAGAASAPAPAPTNITTTTVPAISYQISGHTVTVTPNSAIGAVEQVGSTSFTVGQALTAPFSIPDGDTVPAGAIYIGQQEFELNGNYYS